MSFETAAKLKRHKPFKKKKTNLRKQKQTRTHTMYNSFLVLAILVSFCSANLLQLNEETLQEHNNYRNLHDTNPLQLDEKLIELAIKDAEQYALTGVSNSVVYNGVTLGKNIGIFKGYRSIKGINSCFYFVVLSIS